MRILDRAAFLAMPAGTIFAKFGDTEGSDGHYYFGDVCIKWDTCGEDFVVQDLTAQFDGWISSESHFDELRRMEDDPAHERPPLDYDSAGRDGLFDCKQKFAVWSQEDARRLIACLQSALDAKGNSNG